MNLRFGVDHLEHVHLPSNIPSLSLASMSEDGNLCTSDVEKLLDALESSVSRVEKRLDRIEQLVRDHATGSSPGRRTELRRWTSSAATKVGIRLLRALAKEAVPKNGAYWQHDQSDRRLTYDSERILRNARDVQT